MKHTFLATLIAMLFALMVVSCGEDDIDYIIQFEVRYINETGTSPIKLDFYRNNERRVSITVGKNDTTFVATENNIYRWALPASHDSVVVTFGNSLTKTYNGHGAYVEGVQNPSQYECYTKEDVSKTHVKYTFTFTKDMIE